MTPNELAKLVNRSPLAVRNFLRKEFPRGEEAKHARWFVEPHMVAAAVKFFSAV